MKKSEKEGMYHEAQQSDQLSIQHRADSVNSLPLISEQKHERCSTKLKNNIITEFKYSWALAFHGWVVGMIAFFPTGYMHSVITNAIYRLHERREVLTDLGFELLPELPQKYGFLSNIIMGILFFSLCALALYPCIFTCPKHKNIHFTMVASRYLGSMAFFQFLRCFTFSLTNIPSPAQHCRLDSTSYKPPTTGFEIWIRQDYENGCGDLIFSSHVCFMFTIIAQYYQYTLPSSAERKIRRELQNLKSKGIELHQLLLKQHPQPRVHHGRCFRETLLFDQKQVHNEAIKHLWGLSYWNPVWWFAPFFTILGLLSGVLIVAERKHYSVDVVSSLYITIAFNLLISIYFPDQIRLKAKPIIKRLESINRKISSKAKV